MNTNFKVFVLIITTLILTGVVVACSTGTPGEPRAQQPVDLHGGEEALVRCICEPDTPTPTPTVASPLPTPTPKSEPTNTPVPPTATPTPRPTATPAPSTGKVFGPFNWIPDGDWPFTASRLGRVPSHYELARQNGVTVLAALTGGHSSYTDGSGCFSLEMWQDALDRNNLPLIQSYVDDGTIGGLYAMDEPHDWGSTCGPTRADIDAICAYAKQRLPGILCGVNTSPAWLSGYDYEHLGFIFTQTNFGRTSDWAAWADQQFAAAEWFDGPVWLSINAYTYSPTAAQIRDAAIALCQSPASGVMMWKWGQPDFNSLPGMREAMSEAAAACGGAR